MKAIRIGVFETNSSSTHSITFCTEQQFADFKAGKYVLWNERLLTLDELRDMINKNKYVDEERKANLDSMNAAELLHVFGEGRTYKEWSYGDLDGFSEPWEASWTTPGGEKIVAFGEAGRDG